MADSSPLWSYGAGEDAADSNPMCTWDYSGHNSFPLCSDILEDGYELEVKYLWHLLAAKKRTPNTNH